MTTFLREMIATEYANGVADPHVIAANILGELPNDPNVLREVLDSCLYHEVREYIRERRNRPFRREEPSAGSGSPRWQANIQDVLIERYQTNDGWKLLSDCTLPDIEYIRVGYINRAAVNIIRAERFEALATVMQENNVERVGDLSEEVVVDVLHPEQEPAAT